MKTLYFFWGNLFNLLFIKFIIVDKKIMLIIFLKFPKSNLRLLLLNVNIDPCIIHRRWIQCKTLCSSMHFSVIPYLHKNNVCTDRLANFEFIERISFYGFEIMINFGFVRPNCFMSRFTKINTIDNAKLMTRFT